MSKADDLVRLVRARNLRARRRRAAKLKSRRAASIKGWQSRKRMKLARALRETSIVPSMQVADDTQETMFHESHRHHDEAAE